MKQKITMKVQMHSEKCRTKARKIAAGADGVISIALEGKEKNMVVVTGEGMDAVKLTSLMRKKVGSTDLIKVEEVKAEEKKEVKKPEPTKQQVAPMPWESYSNWPNQKPVYVNEQHPPDNNCSIM